MLLFIKVMEARKRKEKTRNSTTIHLRFVLIIYSFLAYISAYLFWLHLSKRFSMLCFTYVILQISSKRNFLPLGKYMSQIIIRRTYILESISFCMLTIRKCYNSDKARLLKNFAIHQLLDISRIFYLY